MANFQATTVTEQSATVKNKKTALEYINNYFIDGGDDTMSTEIDENNQLHVYGYGWFAAYNLDEDGEPIWDEDVSESFFEGLKNHIDDLLVIIMVGAEKCRYASACKIEVTPEKVEYTNL